MPGQNQRSNSVGRAALIIRTFPLSSACLRRRFNPDRRLSAEDALPSSTKAKDGSPLTCHTYVSKFWDPANEPVRTRAAAGHFHCRALRTANL